MSSHVILAVGMQTQRTKCKNLRLYLLRFPSADPRSNLDGGIVFVLFNCFSKMCHVLFTAFCVLSRVSVDCSGSTSKVTLVCITLNKQ